MDSQLDRNADPLERKPMTVATGEFFDQPSGRLRLGAAAGLERTPQLRPRDVNFRDRLGSLSGDEHG